MRNENEEVKTLADHLIKLSGFAPVELIAPKLRNSSMRLTLEQLSYLDALAEETGMSRNTVGRLLINYALNSSMLREILDNLNANDTEE